MAQQHLKEVGDLLGKVDPNLTELANKSVPEGAEQLKNSLKKRKVAADSASSSHVPKKKNVQNHERSETQSLSQREDQAMKNLTKHILDCGGKPFLLLSHL